MQDRHRAQTEEESAIASPTPPEGSTAVDPVCGMSVTVETAKHVAEHGGERHSF